MDAAVTLRTTRKRAGLSLRALAERAGTSHATLSAYETGAKVPRVDTLDRIVRAAGFASDIDLAARTDGDHRSSKGDELVAVLELAEQFPARHAAQLTAPVFGRRPAPAPAAA